MMKLLLLHYSSAASIRETNTFHLHETTHKTSREHDGNFLKHTCRLKREKESDGKVPKENEGGNNQASKQQQHLNIL